MGAAALLTAWERAASRRGPLARALALVEASPDAAAVLPVGTRDAALLALREFFFGRGFDAVTNCPSCAEAIELTFDSGDVRRRAEEPPPLSLDDDDVHVEFRVPTCADLAAAEGAGSLSAARAIVFARCVTRVTRGGEEIATRELPAALVDRIVARMAEADPQADVALELSCPSCGHPWRAPFDAASFVWSELSAAARALLADVNLLASAYGWSESDILALTTARREAYLEMLR